MAQLARLAGVSASTVSRALADNPLIAETTRRRIQVLAERTGFVINPAASSLRLRRSNVIAVLVSLADSGSHHVSDPFLTAMLAHLADALADAGFVMQLLKLELKEAAAIERVFTTNRPAGALLLGPGLRHWPIERAARTGLPLVAWGACSRRQSYVSVGSDNHRGGMLATAHLLASGRRRIAFLGPLNALEVGHRLDGYRSAHEQAGVAVDPALIARCGFDPNAAAQAADALIQGSAGLDAIVAGSDVIAITAVRSLRLAGREVPGDVAVVGYDDVPMAAYLSPSITTIRQDLVSGARLLVRSLAALIEGQPASSVVLPAELVIRETSLR